MKKLVQYQFILVVLALVALFYVALKPPEYVERETRIELDLGGGDTASVSNSGVVAPDDEPEEDAAVGEDEPEEAPEEGSAPEPAPSRRPVAERTPVLRPDPEMGGTETGYNAAGRGTAGNARSETVIP